MAKSSNLEKVNKKVVIIDGNTLKLYHVIMTPEQIELLYFLEDNNLLCEETRLTIVEEKEFKLISELI